MRIHYISSSVDYDSSIYLVESDRTMLVDAGTGLDPTVTDRIRAVLRGRPLDMVVATHCHYDHIGGIPAVVREFGCPVYAGEADADVMRRADDRYMLAHMFGGSVPAIDAIGLEDGGTVDIGDEFTVISTPGHTAGSICLFNREAGILISGDTLFQMGVGRTDFPGGSMTALRSSLLRISNLDIRELYPGHGSMCRWDRSMTDRVLAMVGV